MMKYRIVFCSVALLLSHLLLSQELVISSTDPGDQWVGKMVSEMSLDEKVGQLFMIRAHTDKGQGHKDAITKLVEQYQVGGICFFQGDPTSQASFTNRLQKAADIPLMIAIDAEWGLGMRFPESAISFPKQMTLGAITDNNIIYRFGEEVARQLNRIGVNVNFAPVVDVNNNPDNPVINFRSFGEDIFNVSAKGYAYTEGMQDNGILACAKHFPGHGDTNVDSHYDLPILKFERERLDSIELAPFKALSELGVGSVMSAHLHVPSIDERANRPTTLSANAINTILRKELNFDGLVFTDAMEMQGVAKHFEQGEGEIEAFLAGNDVLLLPIDLKTSFDAVKKAVESGRISEQRLNESVMRILRAKFKLGLDKTPVITSTSTIDRDINNAAAKNLHAELLQKAMTLVKNDKFLVPIKNVQDKKFASISLGVSSESIFQKRLKSYANFTSYYKGKTISATERQDLVSKVADADIVFVSIHDMSSTASKGFGISQDHLDLIYTLNARSQVVLTIFGSPYALTNFHDIGHVLVAYEESDLSQEMAAQGLFGVYGFEGRLPITASEVFPFGTQILTSNLQRFGYDEPESVGIDSEGLASLDSLFKVMIDEKAAPGCQILIAKDRKIVYNEAFGHHTYSKKNKVKTTDLYDVASITKILATTISLMSLKDAGDFNEKIPLKHYITELDTTNKSMITGEEVLAHHSRLAGWIPFYEDTMDEDREDHLPGYYAQSYSPDFSYKVCDDMYMCNTFSDSIYNMIYGSDLNSKSGYRYSDLGYYLFHKLVEQETQFRLDRYCDAKFYRPLGLLNIGFNPRDHFDLSRIVPTEKDDYFRMKEIHGYVHDMGAAMLGGVAGHAGLFSNAESLAVLMQMLLNGGSYGGSLYLQPETIRQFTTRYGASTRRGLGFDMKELDDDRTMNMAEEASERTFGHLGFTGTCVWADPEYDLIFIMLANRTYPTMENNKFGRHDYRPKAMSIVYKSMEDYKQSQAN